ncbi:MAG: cell envelope integrity protein CreD [Bacteroidia bacterium]
MNTPNMPPLPQVPYQPPVKKKPSLTVKLLVIMLLIVILVIPWALLEWLIYDRERTSENAINEVSNTWSREQTVSGPILYVPFEAWNGTSKYTAHLKILPEQLTFDGNVSPEKRHRGIYDVIVYSTALKVTGSFRIPDYSSMKLDASKLEWDKAFIGIGITDMRGIRDEVKLKWGDTSYVFSPGLEVSQDMYSPTGGISSALKLDTAMRTPGGEVSFSFDLNLNGSKELYFEPLGKTTQLKLKSSWPHPSFTGAFLPDKPATVNKDGFTAEWKVLNLNRNFPQAWVDNAYNTMDSRFGVNLMIPVDHYTKSARASKYAILLIGLSFMVYFFVEVMQKMRIHPFQYTLVGLAICIFYTLLISLSEHLAFNGAYWIAAIATISAITVYSGAIFKKQRPTVIMGLVLLMLYGFMFVIIQLQDYALLVGSIALFIVLLILMYLSRKINWYEDEESGTSNDTNS